MQACPDLSTIVGFDVSRETMESLGAFAKSIEKWSRKINLVSHTTLQEIWTRHIVDSAQLVASAPGPIGRWADLGAGGGLPGIVVAILLKQKSADTQFVLVESDKRKAAFLKMMRDEHGLNAQIFSDRIEHTEPLVADVVSARALAPLDSLLAYVSRHIGADGVAILPKGRNFRAELDQAKRTWQFELEITNSTANQDARILRISRLGRRITAG